MADKKPRPPEASPFMLKNDVGDVHVADTLLTNRSYQRAWDLYQKQNVATSWMAKVDINLKHKTLDRAYIHEFMRSFAPETYVIHYYVVDEKTPQVPFALGNAFSNQREDIVTEQLRGKIVQQDVPYARTANPIGSVNNNMSIAIQRSIETIESQLPGRFRFERTQDLAQADITFASVPKMGKRGAEQNAVSIIQTGGVLLNAALFKGELTDNMQISVLHDLLHVLALEHAHDFLKGPGAPSTDKATFFHTSMTYRDNDLRGRGLNEGGGYRYPISLMPADLEALVRLYPIASDRHDKPQIGKAAHVVDSGVTISHSLNNKLVREAVMLPDKPGLVFQPMYDTKLDMISIPAGTDVTLSPGPDGSTVLFVEGRSVLLPIVLEATDMRDDQLSANHKQVPRHTTPPLRGSLKR